MQSRVDSCEWTLRIRILLRAPESRVMVRLRHTCERQPPTGNKNVIFIQTVVSRHPARSIDTGYVPSPSGTHSRDKPDRAYPRPGRRPEPSWTTLKCDQDKP